jgi:hypothetical protein
MSGQSVAKRFDSKRYLSTEPVGSFPGCLALAVLSFGAPVHYLRTSLLDKNFQENCCIRGNFP